MPTRAASGSPRRRLPTRADAASIERQPGPDRPLGVVLVRLRPAEIGEHAVAHVLGDVAAPALDHLGAARPDRRGSPRPCPRDRAAPTARSSRPDRRTAPSAAAARLPQASLWVRPRLGRSVLLAAPKQARARAAIASRSLRRCPTVVTPMSLRSSAVSLGRISASISFSRNACLVALQPQLAQPSRDVHDVHHVQWAGTLAD